MAESILYSYMHNSHLYIIVIETCEKNMKKFIFSNSALSLELVMEIDKNSIQYFMEIDGAVVDCTARTSVN
jgi:hypothetical protein